MDGKETVKQWQCSDNEVGENLLHGVKLVCTLHEKTDDISKIMWSADGQKIASLTNQKTLSLWDTETGIMHRMLSLEDDLREKANSIVLDPSGYIIASCNTKEVKLWDASSGKPMRTLQMYDARISIHGIAFHPEGRILAIKTSRSVELREVSSGRPLCNLLLPENQDAILSMDPLFSPCDFNEVITFDPTGQILASYFPKEGVCLWNVSSGKLLLKLQMNKPSNWIYGIAFDKDGRIIALCGDKTIELWEISSGKLLRILEGHTGNVNWIEYSSDGKLLGSESDDGTVRLWRSDTFETTAVISEQRDRDIWHSSFTFHPKLPILATIGSTIGTPKNERSRVIHIWKLDFAILLSQVAMASAHYVNAKVALVGDTGVGKTGLCIVLNNKPFEATDSTPGRRVWTFDSHEMKVGNNIIQTRETLLWDLAGQPSYRIIHQLHLNEVAVALVVFDARSETDPLSGVRHWERALRLAQQCQGALNLPMKKFLVSARNDRGGVSISPHRLQAVLKEFGFDGYFKTSAKEGWGIIELRSAVKQAIAWEELPEVSSSQLFADIKLFLLEMKETGRLLAPASQLFNEFSRIRYSTAMKISDLKDQFSTCIGLLENRDLIRRLSFGGYVLLQPELLDAYASAMVNMAKEEPDGFGSLAEEIALSGRFFIPKEQKIADASQEQLLLYATVEELVRFDIALRENADDGRYLVFPSQFNRDYEDAPEPKGKAAAITFDGPVQSLYSTLAVRLNHSGLFTTGRPEMWRNAAVFTAKAGGKCGLLMHEFTGGRGRLILFFDEQASPETQFHFEEFVLAHAKRRALAGTVELVRFFVCPDCGDPVPDSYVKRLRDKGKESFDCPCGGKISLIEPKDRDNFLPKVESMDRSADLQRNLDAFIMSAEGETSTRSFLEWAGGGQITLAIVFTNVIGSSAFEDEIRDKAMKEARHAYFLQSRKLIAEFQGREIKTIGDNFMVAFRSVNAALDYARTLQTDSGHPQIQIRSGVHIGSIRSKEGDIYGGTINFAARMVEAVKGTEIWLSDRAKSDIVRLGTTLHNQLTWHRYEAVTLKGFPYAFTIWSLKRPRNKVFISYSHKDKKIFDEFRTMLAPAIKKGIVELWDDTKIQPGTMWREKIKAGIEAAKVGVLLVSPNFLASDFIAMNELPPLLKAAQEENVTIFWVCLSSCLYRETEIDQYHAAHDIGRPLDKLKKAERMETLKDICSRLIQIASNQ